MKNKIKQSLYKGSCVLLATTFVGSFCIKSKGVSEKVEIQPKNTITTNLNKTNENLKIGSFVRISGRGNESSDGLGDLGKTWEYKEMMVVGIRENSEYPYACAIIDSTPGSEDIMAWFKLENISLITEDTVLYKEPTEDGAPFGYAYDSVNDRYTKTVRKYVSSNDSKEEIVKQYSLKLK